MTTPTPAQPRLLTVDDEPVNIEILAGLFEDDHEVLFATNGPKALEIAATAIPDLILLDVMMPGMDGHEVCRRLKANPATRDIPVIFVTAMSQETDETRGFELGAVDYITKPFRPAVVRARVHTHLELSRSRKTIELVSAQRREMVHVLCHDLANPLGGLAGLLEIIESWDDFLEYKPHLVRDVQNGLAVIDMVRSMQALESGKLSLGPVDLAAALDESRAMLQLKLEDKAIRIEMDAPRELLVTAEPTSLVNSVLNNLYTNAIKFSHRGGVIDVRAAAHAATVTVVIRDHGIGMPPALCAALFDMKKSTSRMGTAGEKGTGFGMPLVKRFMQSYGGTIEVQSSEAAAAPDHHGTTVTLTFPPG